MTPTSASEPDRGSSHVQQPAPSTPAIAAGVEDLRVRIVGQPTSKRARAMSVLKDIALCASLLTAAWSVWWNISDRRIAAAGRLADEAVRSFDRAWDVVSGGRIDGAALVRAIERIGQAPGGALDALKLRERNLYGLALPGASLVYAEFEQCFMPRANFTSANVAQARLMRCELDNAVFKGAKMDGVFLTGSSLYGADFEDAFMHNAYLKHANCDSGRFVRTDLRLADLTRSTFYKAVMEDVALGHAELKWTTFEDVVFQRTSVAGAIMLGTLFVRCDLSGAAGLTSEQLAKSIGDSETRLPPQIVRPAHWSLAVEEQRLHVESLMEPQDRLLQQQPDPGEAR